MVDDSDPETPTQLRYGWVLPESLSVVVTGPAAPRSIGNALILRGSLPDSFRHDAPTNAISFSIGGRSAVECKTGGRLVRFTSSPGGFTITPAASGSAYRFDRPLESLCLAIDPAQFQSIADREFRPYSGNLELLPVHHATNPEIVALGHRFAALLRSPRPGNRLYSEALWTQVAVQILWGYSSLPRRGTTEVERLSNARFRRVIEYLESTLHEDISLADLADQVGLSANHFGVAFKKLTGKTPHRYRTERRVARACELLTNPTLPIVSVALAVGFSSQSHFTTVFGRVMKTTPAAYREQVLGLASERPD